MDLFFIIVVLVAALALLGYAIFRQLRPRVVHCPHCNCSGKLRLAGRYQCSVCDRIFFISSSGRHVGSLKPLVRFHLIASAVVLLVGVGVGIYMGKGPNWGMFGFICISLGMEFMALLQTKRFPGPRA